MQLRSLGLAGVATFAVAFPASSHHSHGAYAMTEYTEIEGVVTELYWINPHAWFVLGVWEGDAKSAWGAVESGGGTPVGGGGGQS